MDSENFKSAYLRAERETPSVGIASGVRQEPTLDEARSELAQSLSRVIHTLFKDKYGPLVGALSQPTIEEMLKQFEGNLNRAKGDVTLVAQELLDRILPPSSRHRR
ncbi:MAG: hypothetical protein EB105_05055 [Actinobacteria bacterium]|nr:hypothetical protein [Actinomycetota bacterium]